MKNLKRYTAVFVVVAALVTVTSSFAVAGHVVRGGHGPYDCVTDSFEK